MTDIETEDPARKLQASIELANAYREMMAMFAWKHLKGVVMARIMADSNKAVDQLDIKDLTLAQVAEARGMRKALEQIETEINWILNAHEAITRR